MAFYRLLVLLIIALALISVANGRKKRRKPAPSYVGDDLLRASLVHDVLRVKELLSRNPNELSSSAPVLINRMDENYGRTSVMVCGKDPQKDDYREVDQDCLHITKLLHEAGAQLNLTDNTGWDALSLAAYRGFGKVTKYLLKTKEVNANQQDALNRTALMKAAIHGHNLTYSLLVKGGASLELRDSNSLSSLHYAALAAIKDLSLLSFLSHVLSLHSNESVSTWMDKDGRTVLMYAAIANSLEVIEAILLHSIDVTVKDVYDKSAVDLASSESVRTRLREAAVEQVHRQHAQWLMQRIVDQDGDISVAP